jgi:DNA-binding response OmpR family regulator
MIRRCVASSNVPHLFSGFHVVEADTGEQALAVLSTDRFDVVLLDITVPGMGGLEACEEIQKHSERPAILMLTVCDSEDDRAKAFAAGADDYITKPIPIRDLVVRIRAALPAPSWD